MQGSRGGIVSNTKGLYLFMLQLYYSFSSNISRFCQHFLLSTSKLNLKFSFNEEDIFLVCDTTCSNMFSGFNLAASAANLGVTTRKTQERQSNKYRGLNSSYQFVLITIKTLVVLILHTINFLCKIGIMATHWRNEPHKVEWLLQWVSLDILCSNTKTGHLS